MPKSFKQPRKIQVGEPTAYPFAGKKFHLDTMPLVPSAKVAAPTRYPLNTNRIKTKLVQEGYFFATPKKFTPGQGGVSAPRKIVIPSREVVAIPSGVRSLRRPGVNPSATHDIRYWNMEHGLNTYFVHALHEDRKGYLWLGSRDDGLARFDGNSVIDYNWEALSFAGGGVNHIEEAKEGGLWLSMARGLMRFNGATFRYYTEHPLFEKRVTSTFEDKDGTLWIVIRGKGMLRYDSDDAFTLFDTDSGLPGDWLGNVVQDKNDDLWFTASGALVRFDGTSFHHYRTEDQPENFLQSPITLDAKKNLWIGTNKGLIHYNGEEFALHALPAGYAELQITRLEAEPDGSTVWGAGSLGLFSFEDGIITRYHEAGLSSSRVYSLMVSKKGQVWAGTHGGGLNKLTKNSFTYLFPQLPGEDVSIAKSSVDREGNIFLGTRGHGMLQLTANELLHYAPPEEYRQDGLVNLTTDPEGNVWLGYNFDHAVTKWNGKTRERISPVHGLASGYCTDLITDRRGRIWGAFENGLSIIDGNTITTFDTSMSRRWQLVVGLEPGKDDDVWVSTTQGVALFRGDSIYWYEGHEDIPFAAAYHLEYIPEQGLMITVNEGLALLKNDELYYYGEEQGLETAQAANIETDPWGTVWADTKFGLFRVNVATQHIEPYHLADGLRSETSSAKGISVGKDSLLWVANSSGIAALDLRELEQRDTVKGTSVNLNGLTVNESRLYFTADTLVQFNNGSQSLSGFYYDGIDASSGLPHALSVPSSANHFRFDFIAFHWPAPHKVSYRYRLLGQEKDWSSEETNNTVDYRGLSHGTYTFEAQARSQVNTWGEPLHFTFTIRPPWWYSRWAYLLYGGLALAVFRYALQRFRRRIELSAALDQEQAEANRLRELDTFKSRLYTNLTHEFRTPLTVILGMARQLKHQPEQASFHSQLIVRNGERLLRLINQLLDLSKLENNALKLNIQQRNIIPFLRFLTNAFQTYANGKNLTLQFFANEEELVMDYDAEQVQQVVSNLISNAIKFTPEGGGVVTRAQRKSRSLEISVSDTGIGIPPAEQANIFNRFYQVDGTQTRQGEGTGIGLAHTRELVKLMGGTITLTSSSEKGSTFTVSLPIKTEAPLATENKEGAFNAKNGTLSPLVNPKLQAPFSLPEPDTNLPLVLVIEDNADVVTYLKTCLHPTYRVIVALNGKIGTKMAFQNIPDLIISDVMMPEMDGFQVCDLLKNDDKTSHIPIILLTAKADAASRLDGLARGADAYLPKPFDLKELHIRLRALLERQQRMATFFSANGQQPTEPTEKEEVVALKIENAFVRKLEAIVAQRFHEEDFSLLRLCEEVNMSRSQLFRKLKAVAGISPSAFIRNYRIEKARELLLSGEFSVAEVAFAVGFREPAHFSKVFREIVGVSPSAYAARKVKTRIKG